MWSRSYTAEANSRIGAALLTGSKSESTELATPTLSKDACTRRARNSLRPAVAQTGRVRQSAFAQQGLLPKAAGVACSWATHCAKQHHQDARDVHVTQCAISGIYTLTNVYARTTRTSSHNSHHFESWKEGIHSTHNLPLTRATIFSIATLRQNYFISLIK